MMINKIVSNIDFDLREEKNTHWKTKEIWTSKKKKIDVEGITLHVKFSKDQYIELFKRKLINNPKMVEENHAEKWLNKCVIGGITKLRLDK